MDFHSIFPGDRLMLIDGSGYFHRAFHAYPRLTKRSNGAPVGMIAGVAEMLYRLLRKPLDREVPTHAVVLRDPGGKTTRHSIYPAYKANRPPADPDLSEQLERMPDLIDALGILSVVMPGIEADDLVATYARIGAEAGADVTIVSGDKDMMQLLSPGIALYDPIKAKPVTSIEVLEKFGCAPEKVIDVQALIGDATDNVPGIRGIGPRHAAKLISEFGSLDAVLDAAPGRILPKACQGLVTKPENAILSRQLVTLDKFVPVEIDAGEFVLGAFDPERFAEWLESEELVTLPDKVRRDFGLARR